jgi:hypothetical protein
MKFVSRLAVVEAEPFDDKFRTKYYGTCHNTGLRFVDDYLQIESSRGILKAQLGDWIVKGVDGKFYPYKPDVFKANYKAIPE